jgi:hypothetical protein
MMPNYMCNDIHCPRSIPLGPQIMNYISMLTIKQHAYKFVNDDINLQCHAIPQSWPGPLEESQSNQSQIAMSMSCGTSHLGEGGTLAVRG